MEQQGEIILYQPDESVRMEVRIEDETVWLTQAKLQSYLDQKAITNILRIYSKAAVERKLSMFHFGTNCPRMASHTKPNIQFGRYHFCRLSSTAKNATLFRRWASQVLKIIY